MSLTPMGAPDVGRCSGVENNSRTETPKHDGEPASTTHQRLICDCDPKWSGRVFAFLRSADVRVVRTRICAPNCNAHGERFVRSIKFECLHRMIPLGERHLRRAIGE
jgi:hypothetical protein